jgi:hypothetical protein
MTRKELILRALKRAEQTIETCKRKPGEPAPKTDNEKKIAVAILETTARAEGRRDAFEAVLHAMNGSNHMLEYYSQR